MEGCFQRHAAGGRVVVEGYGLAVGRVRARGTASELILLFVGVTPRWREALVMSWLEEAGTPQKVVSLKASGANWLMPGGGELQAVVALGSRVHYYEDAEFQKGYIESGQPPLTGMRDEVVDSNAVSGWGRSEAAVPFLFRSCSTKADASDTDLGVDRAALGRKFGRSALGGGVGVRDDARRGIDDGFLGILAAQFGGGMFCVSRLPTVKRVVMSG